MLDCWHFPYNKLRYEDGANCVKKTAALFISTKKGNFQVSL